MSKPLKIFHINMHHHWGGQPNRVLTESIGLAELGHEVWVAGPRDCMLVRRAEMLGLRTFDELELRRGTHPVSFWRDFKALRALFKRERFDIVHPHGSQDAWIAMLAAMTVRPRPALVRTRHNTFPVAGHMLNRWHYKQFQWVITISPQVNELVSAPTGFPAERITPIYSAPDPDRFTPRHPSTRLREQLGIPAGATVIGKVARLAPEKGHHLFLRAGAKVLKEYPDTYFVCVGKGRSRDAIEKLCEDLGIRNRVVLTGFREDVPDIVALFDVFALTPTSGESLGTSILEAFAMEKPVIATQVGGTGESVRDGQTGILIKPGPEAQQVEELAQAMLKLIEEPGMRLQMGIAGRAMVLAEFSPRGLATKCAAIYERLVAERAGRA